MRTGVSDVVINVEDDIMLLIFVLAVVLPVSTSFWILTSIFSTVDEEARVAASPIRWLLSILVPILIAAWGVKRKSLDYSGALMGVFVGFIITYSNYCFMAALLGFFVLSSKATKFRSNQKQRLEEHYREGGQRNWLQVLCNGGMATEMALVYMIDRGCGERVVDFSLDYRGSWTALGVLAALACSSGDTWASEIGTVIGNSQPYLITSWKRVPRGTNGAISAVGLLCSAFGGFVVGLAYYCCLLISLSQHELSEGPPQWPVLIIGTLAGFLGSLIDSVLGATLQYSGIEEGTGRIVENSGPGIKHISGFAILDNHSINLIASVFTALVIPKVAVLLWEIL